MRPLLLALVFVLLAPEVSAVGARWPGKRVSVSDQSDANWKPLVEQTVALFNQAMPRHVPKLIYRANDARSCADARPRKRTLTVCMTDGTSSWADRWIDHGTINRARIGLPWTPAAGHQTRSVCHELMHALTNIRDNYSVAPDTSCVWGMLPDPGPIDIAYARKVYGKKRHRSSPPDRAGDYH